MNLNLWLKNLLKKLRLNEAAISTFLGGLVVVVVSVLVYNYFSGVNQPATETTQTETVVTLVEENGEMVPENLPAKHVVVANEDLWHISQKYFESGYNWVDIAKENGLADANVITAGQELSIPRVGVKAPAQPEVAAAKTEAVSIETDEYLVQKGDFLWKIALKAYGDGYQWTKIWEANKELIPNSNIIEAGTLLKLPR